VVIYSDSDWGGDPKTSGSMMGIAVFLNGCLVSCLDFESTKGNLSLSSSEAEW
jgi:hypothetical protein